MTDRAPQPVDRQLPTEESRDLLALVREIAQREIRPKAAEEEDSGRFPREVFTLLSEAGLLGLPYDPGNTAAATSRTRSTSRSWKSSPRPASPSASASACTRWPATASPATAPRSSRPPTCPRCSAAACWARTASPSPPSGSDAASLHHQGGARRRRLGHHRHQGLDHPRRSRRLLHRPRPHRRRGPQGHHGLPGPRATRPGLTAAVPEKKMGMKGSPTAQLHFDGVRVPDARRIGEEGQGFTIALAALDAGRLGIAACAIGVAQAALDEALTYALDRKQFGHPIADFQGLRFMLADMATKIEAGRALYLAAARLRDAGKPFSRQAAMAKLFCTDAAMAVTTDAVQVLGGYGYTADFPVERLMREAKVLQIVEGTNQIQRMVIARHLAGPETR